MHPYMYIFYLNPYIYVQTYLSTSILKYTCMHKKDKICYTSKLGTV